MLKITDRTEFRPERGLSRERAASSSTSFACVETYSLFAGVTQIYVQCRDNFWIPFQDWKQEARTEAKLVVVAGADSVT